MTDPFTPLSEDELRFLDEFLLNRPGLEESGGEADEGIISVVELDGFLTAIVSGPEMVPPSQWVPQVWGDVEPVWESAADFDKVFGLIVRHMNGISGMLMEAPEEFEPMFPTRVVDGKEYTILDGWCGAYVRGVMLDPDGWRMTDSEVLELIRPIYLFGSEGGWEVLDQLDEAAQDEYRARVAPACRAIHKYWLGRRQVPLAARKAVKVGRNEPCPCGSGRKFKRCCS